MGGAADRDLSDKISVDERSIAMGGDTLYAPAHNMRPRHALVCWSPLGGMAPCPKPQREGRLRLPCAKFNVQNSLEIRFNCTQEDGAFGL